MERATQFKKDHPYIVTGTAALAVAVAVTPISLWALSSLGFTSSGIGAGTWASGIQSGFGTPTVFSLLQSCGAAKNIGMAIPLAIGAGAGLLTHRNNQHIDKILTTDKTGDQLIADCELLLISNFPLKKMAQEKVERPIMEFHQIQQEKLATSKALSFNCISN